MRLQGLEVVASRGIRSVQTSATGTDWVQLSATAVAANQVVLYNETGTALRWRYCAMDGTDASGGLSLPVADGTAVGVRGIQDVRQVSVQRADHGNTQVTMDYLHEGV